MDGLKNPHKGSLYHKIKELENLHKEINDFFNKSVEKAASSDDMSALTSFVPAFGGFDGRLRALTFLARIGPEMVWENYSETIPLINI